MKIMRKRLVGALLLVSAPSCGRGPVSMPRPDDAPVRTDALEYVLQRENHGSVARAVATFVNRRMHSIYYARCRGGQYVVPEYLVRRTGPDSLRPSFHQFWACVGGTPTGELVPGDSLKVIVVLGGPDQPGSDTLQPPSSFLGLMRIELALCVAPAHESDSCSRLPRAERESNAFMVRY